MNVLAIGDLHEPFCLSDYRKFCIRVDRKERCNKVVFIGDVIDNHYSSYHETDPDGSSAREELDLSISEIRKWYNAFPEAYVVIGNHDRMVHRKAHTAGISKRWIKDYSDVLGTPGWKFVDHVVLDGVMYRHGEVKKAHIWAKENMMSVVQGHWHPECYVHWHTGAKCKVFGMQVGCGVDKNTYGMAYGKHHPHPAIACGTILHGKVGVNHLMEL